MATKVVTMAIWDWAPDLQIAVIWIGRMAPIEATMRMAANVGIATSPANPESSTKTTTIHTPERMEAQRSRAPTATLRAV